MAGSVATANVLGGIYEYSFEGHRFVVRKSSPDRLDVFKDEETGEPLGTIKLGVPGGESGSIWLSGSCIAEFDTVNKAFVITPILQGRLKFEDQAAVNPVDYLLGRSLRS